MNTKTFLIIGVVVAVMVGAAVFLRSGVKQPDTGGSSSGLIVGQNAIYVAEQVPSKTIWIAVVHLEKPGFVVIHEDAAGAPGSILGVSGLLAVGETKNPVLVSLSRMTEDDETIYVMLHLDDGDGVFDARKDTPAEDRVSDEPVMMSVTISVDADESGVVNP